MDRREQISRAAFASIAERGFEGLRMREVADRAGVNIATVHYYFGGKEQLIHAAYLELQQRFRATIGTEGSAADRLTDHLHSVSDMLLGDDALRSVLSEIALRARRDPELHEAIGSAEATWFSELEQLLTEGRRAGEWAAPVDPGATAALLIALCKGACLPVLATARPTELASAFDQVLTWLTGAAQQ